MTRRIVLLTRDKSFEKFVTITALTLTKLNYQIDISPAIRSDASLIILDFDNSDNLDMLKFLREDPIYKHKKIMGVVTETQNNFEKIFKAGCDSIMSKKEFQVAGNNVLMY